MKHVCLILALLSTLGCTAFADEPRSSKGDAMKNVGPHSVRLVDDTNVLTLSGNDAGFIASYLAMTPANSQKMANRIIMLMKAGPAVDEQFLEFVEQNIENNRRLKKSDFELSLTSTNGKEYQFSYASNREGSLFVLNYRIMD